MQENSDKLKSMSENEIAEAQAELLNSLPPTILAYFRNKKNSPESSQVLTAKNNPEVAAQDMKDVTDSGSVKVTNKLPDRLSELLEDFITNPVGNWRFDLEGSQLNSSEQETLPVHIGLHHHGILNLLVYSHFRGKSRHGWLYFSRATSSNAFKLSISICSCM